MVFLNVTLDAPLEKCRYNNIISLVKSLNSIDEISLFLHMKVS